jgi:hypothetical protein
MVTVPRPGPAAVTVTARRDLDGRTVLHRLFSRSSPVTPRAAGRPRPLPSPPLGHGPGRRRRATGRPEAWTHWHHDAIRLPAMTVTASLSHESDSVAPGRPGPQVSLKRLRLTVKVTARALHGDRHGRVPLPSTGTGRPRPGRAGPRRRITGKLERRSRLRATDSGN